MSVDAAAATRSDAWPVSWTGDSLDYHPVPQSWLDHPAAEDRDARAGPRLLAVSAARYGSRTLRVRYVQPRNGQVLITQTGGIERGGGVVPSGLETMTGWPRSLRPGPSDPHDEARRCEREHLRAVWGEVLDGPADWGVHR